MLATLCSFLNFKKRGEGGNGFLSESEFFLAQMFCFGFFFIKFFEAVNHIYIIFQCNTKNLVCISHNVKRVIHHLLNTRIYISRKGLYPQSICLVINLKYYISLNLFSQDFNLCV